MPISETTRLAELRAAAEKATRGPWQVIERMHPWAMAAEPEHSLAAKSGVHTERTISTAWIHGQLKAPWPVVELSFGRGNGPGEPQYTMVRIDEPDAAHIANCDPQTILALLDEIEALRKANTKLHRRAQIAEAFMQSCDDHPAAWLRVLQDRRPHESGIIRKLIEDITKAKEKAARRALTEGTAE